MDQRTPLHLAFDVISVAREASARAARRAIGQDRDDGFPTDDVRGLAEAGLLAAPVPPDEGGAGLGYEPGAAHLAKVLRLIGYGSLTLGRIYEGHVNALQLVSRYGSPQQKQSLFEDAVCGHLFGVWNTEPPDGGLRMFEADGRLYLEGVKTFASGAGFVTRALVTARRGPGDRSVMLVVPLDPGTGADLSKWQAHGMRGSATGTLNFSGLTVAEHASLGAPDDYHRQPYFSAGAWRFAAVQLGGIEAVFDAWRHHIVGAGRATDPHQLARLGEGAIAVETARQWVQRAASVVTADALPADRIVAFANFARLAVERAGLDVLQLAQRSVGLQGFLRSHPLERLSRDLSTYLRQPAPDQALTTAATTIATASELAGDLWPT